MAVEGAVPDLGTLQVTCDGEARTFEPGSRVLVGRDPACDIAVPDERVSRQHLELRSGTAGWELTDLRSSNGTWVDGARCTSAVLPLHGPVSVRLGDAAGPELTLHCGPGSGAQATVQQVVLGRDPGCDVVVDDPLVSRRHAVIQLRPQALLRDLGSFNGTYRNGRPVTTPQALEVGDTIGVGNQTLVWTGDGLDRVEQHRRSLDARALRVTTGTGAVLLDDVSLTFPAGTVTAVIGPSGAGKSTLMGALTGLRPATQGSVLWAGRDLYAEYAQLRSLVGLVPQEDIVHRQLTVARALRFAARLRLPPETDLEARVDQVLAEVRLTAQKGQRIDSLSGGQLKRTSIALELLTAPQLLFLDEPTSGLDPGLDRQVMVELRGLADAGRVVVVVTHSVLALDVCDHVLLLAPGGRVAFFGPPARLLPFFGVQDYPSVFAALKDPSWVQRYAESSIRAKFVGRAEQARIAPADQTPPPRRPAPLRQLGTLVSRNLAVAAADRMFLVLLVVMPIVLALMVQAFPGESGLSMREADGQPLVAQQRLLALVVCAALMGAALSVRELVTERPIYRREYAVGLSPPAYLASKVLVLGALVAVQAVAFTLLALWGVEPPDDPLVLPWGRLEVAAAVAAVAVAMTAAGLAVSAAARSVDQTMPALVGLVMAQIVFCGGLFSLAGRPGLEQLSWILPGRLGFAAGAATIGLQQPDAPDPDPLYDSTAGQWLFDMGILGLQTLAFIVVAGILVARSATAGGRR